MEENFEMFKEYPDIISVEDLMRMLNIGRNSAYDLIKSGKIKSVKIKRKYIIPKRSVIDMFKCANE